MKEMWQLLKAEDAAATRRFFLALILGVTAIRVAGLAFSQAELFYDEAQYWAWGQEPAFGYFSKPPLLAWLIGAVTSVCGNSEFCVRLPAPFIHAGTSVFLFALANRMFGPLVALLAGALFLTMPGTSLSSTLMSTDVPLLFFWSAALYALWRHAGQPSLGSGLAAGLAIGLGANAKYAMLFLPACFVLMCAVTPQWRSLLWHKGSLAALAVIACLLAPNLHWVLTHGNVTFSHTASDAGKFDRFPNLAGLAEFILAQGGIIGPLAFLWYGIFFLALSTHLKDLRYRYLFVLSTPVLIIFEVLALVSKANGNWAATAFPALVILVSAFMLERRAWRSIAATFAIAGVCLIALASYGALAGRITVQPIAGELAKLQGWSATASEIAGIARRADTDTVVTYGRALSASMTYYLRDTGLSVKAFRRPGAPGDYFEMTHPWRADYPGPVLIVKTGGPPPGISAERLDEGQCFQSRIYQHRRSGAELCAYRVE